MKCVFSVDVEDWFHILDLPTTPEMSEWDGLPSRVERNFHKLLDILDETKARATCFFLGWVAQRFPHLVREADERGHEIASHSYAHKLVYQLTREQFLEDATRSRKVLEDIAGRRVLGFRSPGFSVTEETPWFFDCLLEAGYGYDSSVFPMSRAHGGMKTNRYAAYRVGSAFRDLVEFPITITTFLGKPFCCFGGGYLRLFPLFVIRRMTRRVLAEGRPVLFYVHPREIDPAHPRLPMGLRRRFQSYVNLKTVEPKIRSLLAEFEVTTFRDCLSFVRADPVARPELNWMDAVRASPCARNPVSGRL
jgi:polysaccharide deacetylase family protein (PEP-CTERM system associated)